MTVFVFPWITTDHVVIMSSSCWMALQVCTKRGGWNIIRQGLTCVKLTVDVVMIEEVTLLVVSVLAVLVNLTISQV